MLFFMACASCTPTRKASRLSEDAWLTQPALLSAHVGLALYDPATGRYQVRHNSDRLFIPASTTKLFTLYAGLSHLPDSISSFRYRSSGDTLQLIPLGDPSFLHPRFLQQPAREFLKHRPEKYIQLCLSDTIAPYNPGCSWDDMGETYMPQQSALPVYGNLLKMFLSRTSGGSGTCAYQLDSLQPALAGFRWRCETDSSLPAPQVQGNPFDGEVRVRLNGQQERLVVTLPLDMSGESPGIQALTILTGKPVEVVRHRFDGETPFRLVPNIPADSLFRLMMFRSDNLIANQVLLMIGAFRTGRMRVNQVIDTLMAHDMADLPQSPRWVDGSGLSRYNLFTPEDEVQVMKRLMDRFGERRLRSVLPTAGEGTLTNLFPAAFAGRIYAKTGSMSNQFCLAGLIYNKKQQPLIFSVMVNHHTASSAKIRNAVKELVSRWMEE